jgi:hypothetical protein
MNPVPRRREINPETRSVESPDVSVMQVMTKSTADGVGIVLAIALLAACSVNLVLLCAWL